MNKDAKPKPAASTETKPAAAPAATAADALVEKQIADQKAKQAEEQRKIAAKKKLDEGMARYSEARSAVIEKITEARAGAAKLQAQVDAIKTAAVDYEYAITTSSYRSGSDPEAGIAALAKATQRFQESLERETRNAKRETK